MRNQDDHDYRYNEAVKKLKKRAKLHYLIADLRDAHYTAHHLIKTLEKVKIRLQTMKSFLLSLNTFFYG